MSSREAAIEQLERRKFDLLVIGGGIVGAGIAAEAARSGLAVALVERGDFGGATSTASSKLIHGGLRYLRLGDVGLVREAHHERRLLTKVVAPHLTRRLPFLLPLYREGPYRPATIQAGLLLYGALAHSRLHRLASPERALGEVPGLRRDGLRSCGVYADAVTHDGRLCLANVRAAADAGATVLNYAALSELHTVAGRIRGAEVVVDGNPIAVSARVVVNATGPWVDEVRKLEDPSAAPTVRLSKGAHALLRLEEPWSAALAIPHDKVRVSFAVPWEGMLLLGTTDTLYEEPPSYVDATEAEVGQILDEAGVAVEPHLLRSDAVRSTFAGLRVLPLGDGDTATARRETIFHRGRGGMLSVAGGKLTTYRRIAHSALEALRSELGVRQLDLTPVPLPGAVDPGEAMRHLAARWPSLDSGTLAYLVRLYGGLAEDVLAPATESPDLLEALHPDGPDIAAQVVHAREAEWACSVEDILERRTTLALRGLANENVVTSIDQLAGRAWSGGPSEPAERERPAARRARA